jgi:hypothetical protein
MGRLRNYIYRSDRKIDLLYSQVPLRRFDKLLLKLGISAGIAKVEISTDKQFVVSQESKLSKIEKDLESSDQIGTIENPKEFFFGKCACKLIVSGYKAFLVGWTKTNYVGLCCSLQHMVGYEEESALKDPAAEYRISSSNYGFASVLDKIGRREENFEKARYKHKKVREQPEWFTFAPKQNVLDAVVRAANNWPGGRHPYEFLAVTMSVGKSEDNSVILGSPLYVDQLPSYEIDEML